MDDLFETDEIENKTEETHEMGQGLAQPDKPIKVKKPRKPLTEERKIQLREQLKKGRETSLAKRQKVKKDKVLTKVKDDDLKVNLSEVKVIEPVKKPEPVSNYEKEIELEDRLTTRIRNKIKKEQEDEKKNNELVSLRAQLAELKKPKEPVIKEVPKQEKPLEPTKPRYSKFSPHKNHFMGGSFF